MNVQLNVYQDVKHPTVLSAITSTDWFELIKDSEFSSRILKARQNKVDYNKVKLSLPCVTYNFLFNNKKENAKIIAPTGIMYIDVDSPEFDISTLDKSKLFAYYHSFGGVGYAILVKVDGLTLDNFKATCLHISKELGIEQYIDTNAIKATQCNVLSYDKDIYVNNNSHVFNAIDTAPLTVVKEERRKAYTIDGGALPIDTFTTNKIRLIT